MTILSLFLELYYPPKPGPAQRNLAYTMDREQASYLYKLMPNVEWVHDYLLNWICTTDAEKDTSCCVLMHAACVCVCVCLCSVMSDSLQPHGL